MEKKRMFQVLDEMNVHDIEHKTRFVTLHPEIIQLQHTKSGTKVTMGVPKGIIDINNQMSDNPKKRLVLMIVDGDAFDRRNTI